MKTLTTWGGLDFVDGRQVRVIVATTTKKRARELLNVSDYEFREFYCETGNQHEIRVAEAAPENVFYNMRTRSDKDFVDRESCIELIGLGAI